MLLLLRVGMCSKVLDVYLRQNHFLKRLEKFWLELFLDFFVGHAGCFMQKFFRQLLVNIPDVSALEL